MESSAHDRHVNSDDYSSLPLRGWTSPELRNNCQRRKFAVGSISLQIMGAKAGQADQLHREPRAPLTPGPKLNRER
jgi:hypothetical protein